MRVLFVSGAEMPDYQCDMLLHGLRELLGADAVDVRRVWYMYAEDFAEGKNDKAALYGRGFTMYGLLGNDADVDRGDIQTKIATRFFDLIVYGSIRRCQDYLNSVLLYYPPEKIAFVDGEDDQSVLTPLLGRGFYFKRELNFDSQFVKPIQFAIPRIQVGKIARSKTKIEASIDPRDRSTYIYDTEHDYYCDYAESLFGLTQKKAGWDCLRHYEIIANACIPSFDGLEDCPPLTMIFLPKYELLYAKVTMTAKGTDYFATAEGRALWEELHGRIDNVLHNHLTTIALARYLLDVVRAPGTSVTMLSSVGAAAP